MQISNRLINVSPTIVQDKFFCELDTVPSSVRII